MWISQKMASIKNNILSENSLGEVTNSNGSNVTIQSASEYREIPLIAPYGIAYVPYNGDETVVIPVAGKQVCLGSIVKNKNLNPGELMLFSKGGAKIILKNDGTVIINGTTIQAEVND